MESRHRAISSALQAVSYRSHVTEGSPLGDPRSIHSKLSDSCSVAQYV
jgi:hypothetical protein